MSDEMLIGMQRLNPTQNVDDEVYMGFFPPSDDYYTDLLQDKSFENFLLSDGTTKDGQDRIADFYQVTELWKQMEKFDDYYLVRFLKARKFDLKETLIMWSNFIKWRKQNQVD